MTTLFLSKNYVALSLIRAKHKIFDEDFVTMSEFNRFTLFMQEQFNKRHLDIIITHDLSREDFDIINEQIIMVSDKCCFNLDMLSTNILAVLTDSDLISNFFINFEGDRLQKAECTRVLNSESHQKKKTLTL